MECSNAMASRSAVKINAGKADVLKQSFVLGPSLKIVVLLWVEVRGRNVAFILAEC